MFGFIVLKRSFLANESTDTEQIFFGKKNLASTKIYIEDSAINPGSKTKRPVYSQKLCNIFKPMVWRSWISVTRSIRVVFGMWQPSCTRNPYLYF